jgi:hypothetical protein
VEKKKRQQRVIFGLPAWMWLAIMLFFVMLMLGQCVLLGGAAG